MTRLLAIFSIFLFSNLSLAVEFEAGSSGGGSGTPFSDNPPSDFSHISIIQLCGGSKVDSIEVFYEDYSGNTYSYGKRGGNGGSCSTIHLWNGEYITSIAGKHGTVVDSLVITTNQGRVLSKGGSGGYASFKYTGNDQFKISGFKGKSNNLLTSIGVIYTQSY